MEKMGYIFGAGLGKDSDGRVEPVSTRIYPTGKSLDWCMDNRDTVKDMKDVAEEAKKPEKTKGHESSSSVFDLLNAACSSQSVLRRKRPRSPSPNGSKDDSLKLKGFKLDQSILNLRQE